MNSESRKKRLKEIPEEIKALTRELEALLLQEETTHNLQVNDRVVITNSYLGLRGRAGTIVRVTQKQYQIKLDNGTFVNRSKTNVKKDDRPRSE
jgi:hypothetical protein